MQKTVFVSEYESVVGNCIREDYIISGKNFSHNRRWKLSESYKAHEKELADLNATNSVSKDQLEKP